MARRIVIAGLAALLATGCGKETPPVSSSKGPIHATRITSEKEYAALTDAVVNLEDHRLDRDVYGSYGRYAARACVYVSNWSPEQKLYVLELRDEQTNNHLYAATPLGKERPFNRTPTSSKEILYTSEQLEAIFKEIIEND